MKEEKSSRACSGFVQNGVVDGFLDKGYTMHIGKDGGLLHINVLAAARVQV